MIGPLLSLILFVCYNYYSLNLLFGLEFLEVDKLSHASNGIFILLSNVKGFNFLIFYCFYNLRTIFIIEFSNFYLGSFLNSCFEQNEDFINLYIGHRPFIQFHQFLVYAFISRNLNFVKGSYSV